MDIVCILEVGRENEREQRKGIRESVRLETVKERGGGSEHVKRRGEWQKGECMREIERASREKTVHERDGVSEAYRV